MLLELGDDLERLGGAGPRLAVVQRRVVGEEHARADLHEAVEHGADAGVRADGGPDGADGGGGEQGHQGLHVVGDEAGHDGALADAGGAQRARAAAHLVPQLGPRRLDAAALVLGRRDDRRGRLVHLGLGREEQVLGEVETGAGEEVGPREHGRVGRQDLRRGAFF